MSVILPQIPAQLRRTFGRFVGPAGAALFSLALASCAGGGFGGAPDAPATNPASQPAPVASGPISPESQRNVAEVVSGLKLGDETPPISPQDIAVSDDAEILNRNPFSSPPPAARASGWGARADSTRKTPGYKAFEIAVPSENPLMTVAVWISETPPDYPEGKPEQDPEAARKFLYLRLQVFIAVGHVALVEGGGVEVLESQVIVVEEKRPDPQPQPACLAGEFRGQSGNCSPILGADSLCPAGTMPANGLTQAELDYEFLGAVLENDLEGACEYLRRGANIEIREDEVGRPHNLSALMIAAGRGGYNYPDMTRLLLANGADPDSKDGHGWATALHYAAASGHTETAALILDWGGDVNVLSSAGDPPLYQAAHWGRTDMVQLLLSRGADPDIQADTGVAPLHGAASNVARSGSAAVVSLLLSYGADPNPPRSRSNPGLITRAGETGHSPLDDLVARGYGNYAEAAQILRDAGGKCFVRTSPLCPVPEVVTAETICESGSLSANGLTQAQLDAGLISAAEGNDLPGACEYLRRGADIEAREVSQRFRRTALMIAANDGRLDLAKLLYANGADVNRQAGNHRGGYNDSPGWTALHYAATAGHADMVSWLLDSEADVDARWGWGGIPGKSVLWEAAHWGRADVVEILLSRGADPEGGGSPLPLHGALWKVFAIGSVPWDFVMVDYGREELDSDAYVAVVSLLAAAVSDVNTRANGWSALDVAAHEGRSRLAAVLRGFGGKCFVRTGPLCGEVQVAVDFSSSGAGTVSAEGDGGALAVGGEVRQGVTVMFTATPAAGHYVSGWSGNCAEIGDVADGLDGTAKFCAVSAASDLSVRAEFSEIPSLAGPLCPSGSLSANGLTQAELDAGLVSAAKANNLTNACEYLRRGANIEVVYTPALRSGDAIKRTPLVIAAANGRLELSRLLLNNGANVNWQSGRTLPESAYDGNAGWSALALAAAAGHGDVVGLLLDRGANVDIQWDFGRTALHEAAIFGRASVVELLLARGAAVDVRDLNGETALHGAAWGASPGGHHTHVSRSTWEAKWDKALDLLLDAGAEVNLRSTRTSDADPAGRVFVNEGWNGGWTPLDRAVAANKRSRALKLRSRGGFCNVQSAPLCPTLPVTVAVTTAVTTVAPTVVTAETVCESGSLSANGLTQAQLDAGLLSAAKANDLAKVCEHLRRGADMNARDRFQAPDGLHRRTPLMLAAMDNRLTLAKLLVENGADVNYKSGGSDLERQDGAGWSALMYAAGAGQVETATYLLDQGAEIDMQWASGYSSLHEAAIWGRWETAELLIERGANVNLRGYGLGETPLHGASWGSNRRHFTSTRPSSRVSWNKVIKALLAGGADVNARGNDDLDALPSRLRFDRVGGESPLDTLVLHHNKSQRAAKLRDAGGYCYVQTSSLCAYPPVAEADSLECPAGTLPTNGLTAAELNMTLRMAARGGDATRACEALRRGAEVNDNLDDSEFTPLQEAVSGGHLEAAKVLLANGAEVNKRKGGAGHSPLDLAARDDQAEIAALLRNADGRCFLETGPLCQNVPVATSDPVTVVNTVAATVANTVASTVASTVAAGSCPAGTLDANGMTQAQLNQAMLDAVEDGDQTEVCEYLRRGADVNAHSTSGAGPTGLFLVRGNVDMAKLLLANGADPNRRESRGSMWPPLMSSGGLSVEVIRLYLSHGADPNLGTGLVASWNSLHEAAYYNRSEVMEALLDGGADPDIQTTRPGWRNGAPLHYVFDGTRSGSASAVSVLVAGDADVNLRDSGGNSALDLAANRGDAASAEILRAAGGQCFVSTRPLCEVVPVATPDPVTVVNTVAATVANTVVATVANTVIAAVENTVASTVAAGSCPAGTLDANGMTQAQLNQAMLDAVEDGDQTEVCEYLRRGADVNAHSTSGAGPTGLFLVRGNVDMAKLLLANGADPNRRESRGSMWPPLMSSGGLSVEVIRLYLSHGADPNLGTGLVASWNSLHEAAYYNRSEVMEALLDGGADPDIQTTRPGWRNGAPLHYVFDGTRSGSASAVSVLVAGDADVNLRDNRGRSALDLAANRGDAASAEILRAAGGQCFVSTRPLCGSAPAPAAAAAESAPATDRLRERFAGAFNPSPAFGDAFGAASGSSQRFLGRLDSLMRSASGSGGNAWDSFAGWQRENEHGRMWFSTGQRGDFGFGAGVGGAGGDLSASPFAAMVGNGMLAGGETGLGADGKLRIAAFADYQARSLLDGTDRQWTKWAASGTAIETAMTEAERFSGLAENQTRGAMTEIHLGGGELGVALQAGAVSESDAMLSGTADDENLRGLRARTAFAGLSGAANLFGSGWRLRGSAHLGRSWAESESMLRDGDLWASAFSAGLERGGWLYSDDGFILRVSQPLRVESLEMELIGEGGASRLGADPSGRQLDVDAAYRLPLSGGGWLLLSAGVRRDRGHTSSSDLEAGALFSVERGF